MKRVTKYGFIAIKTRLIIADAREIFLHLKAGDAPVDEIIERLESIESHENIYDFALLFYDFVTNLKDTALQLKVDAEKGLQATA